MLCIVMYSYIVMYRLGQLFSIWTEVCEVDKLKAIGHNSGCHIIIQIQISLLFNVSSIDMQARNNNQWMAHPHVFM